MIRSNAEGVFRFCWVTLYIIHVKYNEQICLNVRKKKTIAQNNPFLLEQKELL
jgi:hypothetical protein